MKTMCHEKEYLVPEVEVLEIKAESGFAADNVKINGVSKKANGGTLTVLQGNMSLSLTFTDGTSQAFTYTF